MKKTGIKFQEKIPFPRRGVDRGKYEFAKGLFNLWADPSYMTHDEPKGFDVDFSYEIVHIGGDSYLCLHAQKDAWGGLDNQDVWQYITKYAHVVSESPSAWLGVRRSDGFVIIGRGRFTLKINSTTFRHTLSKGWEVL